MLYFVKKPPFISMLRNSLDTWLQIIDQDVFNQSVFSSVLDPWVRQEIYVIDGGVDEVSVFKNMSFFFNPEMDIIASFFVFVVHT